ncbi:MAG: hypothetical protein MJ162_00520 [Treponema sp.]|nr:hypothetical protein [Treponema sp.]
MNSKQWEIFCEFKKRFQTQVNLWSQQCPNLAELQKTAALAFKTPEYPFETPVVYNRDLDKLTQEDEIRLIVIGDNPGKDEQLAKNNRYLVGQAGKIADGFFNRNPELKVDFRKNVIILNKTPVHSAKTNQLRKIMKDGGKTVQNLILESQLWMAKETAALHTALCTAAGPEEVKPELWMVGYAELKEKGFFRDYLVQLQKTYLATEEGKDAWNKVFIFQHFSMNRFTIDLKDQQKPLNLSGKPLIDQIHTVGEFHKQEIVK